jgi:hypothetical protein
MKKFLLPVLLVSFAAAGFAQTGHVGYSPGGPVVVLNEVLPNLACAATIAQINPYNPIAAGFTSTAGTVLGAHALDQDHDLVYVTDGFLIFVAANPLYAPAPCAGGPNPGNTFLAPSAITPFGTPFGLITGMAVGHDVWTSSPSFPCTDVLYVTDGTCVMGFDPRPPFAVVVGPWIAPALPAAFVLTGLEYEDTGTPGLDFLWATDTGGNTYIYDVFGNLAGGPMPVIGPPPIQPVIGNVLDRSTCPPGHWVTDGFFLYPSVFANPTIPLNPTAAMGLAFGASASAEPVLLPGRCGSTCNPNPVITTNEPFVGGKNIVFGLSGAPPGTPAVFAADFVCVPGGTGIASCVWWLPLSFAWPITINTVTNGFGNASAGPIPLPAATCPGLVGATGYAQWFYLDSCSSNGFGITDAMHLRLSTF